MIKMKKGAGDVVDAHMNHPKHNLLLFITLLFRRASQRIAQGEAEVPPTLLPSCLRERPVVLRSEAVCTTLVPRYPSR